jgi:hypothetical protein
MMQISQKVQRVSCIMNLMSSLIFCFNIVKGSQWWNSVGYGKLQGVASYAYLLCLSVVDACSIVILLPLLHTKHGHPVLLPTIDACIEVVWDQGIGEIGCRDTKLILQV